MAEVLFYHLERRSLEDVLPGLLEKCLDRGWRAVVQASTAERCEALDAHLWSYREDSFLPHGASGDTFAAEHPICLTTGPENPNGAVVRFLVEKAVPDDISAYERVVYLFDGGDETAVGLARDQWKAARQDGHTVTYWQQDAEGRWNKKA